MSGDSMVIIGASHAAVQAIDSLRREGYAGTITLVGDEPHLPYNRPPLSKKYFTGDFPADRLLLRAPSFYEQCRVDLRLGLRAIAIDRAARRVLLSDGSALPYCQLVLCTGSQNRRLSIPGHDLPGIHYLRSMADVDAIRSDLATARRLVVVGAGYIGLEVAASARQLGLDVTVLEMAERPLNRVVAPEISEFYANKHRREGVQVVCGASVTGFKRGTHDRVGAVVSGEREFAADLVVVGIGVIPQMTLAAEAGLQCGNGIWVDEQCRTSDPDIFAAGDCTEHPSVHYGRRVRLESVDNAAEQAKTAASVICGKTARHEHVPWFWSDQYDLKLQIAGLSQGYDQTVLRGDRAASRFALYYFAGGELLAVDAINSPKDFMTARRWIAARRSVDMARLGNPTIDLTDVPL